IRLQVPVDYLQISFQILNLAAAKLDVMKAKLFADGLLMFARQLEHRRIEVHADHLALGADDLCTDVQGLAAARAEIENGFSFMDVPRRIAAAVILFKDLSRDNLQQ